MNNLGEVCLVGLGVRGNCVRCLLFRSFSHNNLMNLKVFFPNICNLVVLKHVVNLLVCIFLILIQTTMT